MWREWIGRDTSYNKMIDPNLASPCGFECRSKSNIQISALIQSEFTVVACIMPCSWDGSRHSGVSSIFMRLWPQPTSTFLTPIYFLFLTPSTTLTLVLSLPRSHDHVCFSNIYFTWVGLPTYSDCSIFNRGLLHVCFIYLSFFWGLGGGGVAIMILLSCCTHRQQHMPLKSWGAERADGWMSKGRKQKQQTRCKCWTENVIYHTALQLQRILQTGDESSTASFMALKLK